MPDVLSVTLVPDESLLQNLREGEQMLEVAKVYQIDSQEMAGLANEELRAVISRTAAIKKLREGFVSPAQTIIENAKALFNPALNALGEAEKILRGALTNWTIEQKRIANEARQKAEAEERSRRQEAERIAAAARAKAEQEAAEARRKAAAAEEARRVAEAAGNAKAAAKAAAEAAAQAERAAAVVENAEAKANETLMAAQAQVAVVETPTKVAGFGLRDNWVAEMELPEDRVLLLIVAAIASGRTDLAALLKVDASACNKLAKALKGATSIPGMKAVNRPISTSCAA